MAGHAVPSLLGRNLARAVSPSSRSMRPERGLSEAIGCVTAPAQHRPFAPPGAEHDCRRSTQKRYSSHSPFGAPPADAQRRKKVTLQTIQDMKARGEKIAMMTAHDFPSAHVAARAGMDVVLVGDSLAMVALGMEDTSEIEIEDMLLHCRSVSRGAKDAFVIGDLPMGSYELSEKQALHSAIRFVKEGRVQGVKLEGGEEMASTIKTITQAGIAVIGHIGLTPQRQHALGGFRVQGKTLESALQLLRDAIAVEKAGAFAVVLEAVPDNLASIVTQLVKIPTIGIGAGEGCSGQVLVQADMTGNFPPGRYLPKFVKKYGDVWGENMRALEAFRDEVKSGAYPSPEYSYKMPEGLLGKVCEAGIQEGLLHK